MPRRRKDAASNIMFLKRQTHIPLKEMCTSTAFFLHGRKGRLAQEPPAKAQFSFRGRIPWHNVFLKKFRHRIKSFADVGCAMQKGAPLTVEAREVLPPETRVFAVDTMISRRGQPPRFKDGRVISVWVHSIVEAPLPERVDAIRFTNVSVHLNSSEFGRSMTNIYKSLNPGGYLLHESRVFKKTKDGFKVIARATQ